MNFKNLTKYKLSPVSKINKFSPQLINIHNLKNELNFLFMWKYCDFKLEIKEDEKNNNNINEL